jgi:hypothetical protein
MSPVRTGGDLPDPINTETEYMGKVPTTNSVTDLGPEGRTLENTEKKRLGLLTGQEQDPDAPLEPGFMGGVDSNFPQHDPAERPDENYRSEDYLS